jgi:hypothetical protein
MARPTQGVSFTIKPTDTVLLNKALNDVDRKVRWDTMKVYLRDWAKATRRTMKKFAPKAKAEYNRYREEGLNTPRNGANTGTIVAVEPGGMLRRSITYRVKRYKRGRVIWVGVGGQMPTGKAFFPAGWRGRFPEVGAYNKIHKRVLGRTRYRSKAWEAVRMYGEEQIREAAKAAIRAGGFRT